jgi:putative heme-binding domain-containing protein
MNSPFRQFGEDRLLPRAWDQHLFSAYAKMPYGHVLRTDRDGRTWELVAGGLRNPFGLAFNGAGDLFTYDADMEWDVGLPWYHPTRVLHLVPGGDYGWRRGSGVLPDWSPDTLPSVVDIGLGSPTAVQFGTKSSFPEPWRSALFILDWAYGKIHAIHLQRSGISYTGRAEVFLKGRPLNVTGLDFGPDGALYFVTGGRRTQSGLYRVKWIGGVAAAIPPVNRTTKDESPASRLQFGALSDTWVSLGDRDPWKRFQARVALEMRPVGDWSDSALALTNPTASLTALLALSRSSGREVQPAILRRLHEISIGPLTAEQTLLALRTLSVCCIRQGRPDSDRCREFLQLWESRFPALDTRVNQALGEVLVYLESTNVVRKTLPLLAPARTQEEKLQYLFTLSQANSGWSMADRRTYFDWLGRARREFVGASALPTALNYIRADAESTLTATERAALADRLAALDSARVTVVPAHAPNPARRFVKEWSLADFEIARDDRPRDLSRGARLFVEAGCAQCHRFGTDGGLAGPDLTAVGSRFDRRALLESILEPSRIVAEVYRTVTVTMKSGVILEGRIVEEDSDRIVLATNPIDPNERRRLLKTDFTSRSVSTQSSMPTGLLNTLSRDEILDLAAWLENGRAK